MKTIVHSAASRGHAQHGWLESYHTFSFASYYDAARIHFGALRVLNDDRVAAGMGFAQHPHDNMEIVSIPLEGDLEHRDSMGNVAIIREGDIQVMSAGTGITHSEYNKNKEKPVKFLQIWIIPKHRNVVPRYDQMSWQTNAVHNQWQQILSPQADDAGVWIHQDAWFHRGQLDDQVTLDYNMKQEGNGVYVFVLKGRARKNETTLEKRDGMGLWELSSFQLNSLAANTTVLLMEVPMLV
ncbi:MAG TPA: pirin family protein [Chitinophagaceae bacterium]|nr:pirin family protein [Chitinophagaceae bacterium]